MAQSQRLGPIELYETTVAQARRVVIGVKPEQLHDPTPCSEWDVEALLNHLTRGAGFAIGLLSGEGQNVPVEPRATAVETLDAGVAHVLQMARTPGVLESSYPSRRGEMSGADVVLGQFMDTLIHTWDLAKATGQDTALDPGLVAACYDDYKPREEGLRASTAFGSHVEVTEDADPQTKLLALFGREA
jgi:uncharacterized protein (TIGR03086 family)